MCVCLSGHKPTLLPTLAEVPLLSMVFESVLTYLRRQGSPERQRPTLDIQEQLAFLLHKEAAGPLDYWPMFIDERDFNRYPNAKSTTRKPAIISLVLSTEWGNGSL